MNDIAMTKPVDVLSVMAVAAEVARGPTDMGLGQARSQIVALVECYDAMLARWWSNATDADRDLANRATTARMRFAGQSHSPYPPIDETLGERRREAEARSP